MGLDFSHCEAYWTYSGFMRFRARLATEIGVALRCMEGFAGGTTGGHFDKLMIFGYDENLPGYEKYVGNQSVISWDKVSDDIVPLLDHSDCDGELTPEECKKVAPRLRKLVSGWPDDDRDKVNALELAKGMELALKRNENLRFC